MPTSSGANKRARAEDNESNVAKKKAVFDPKDNADTPKPGGKKLTAAQKRKLEAEKSKAAPPCDTMAENDEAAAAQAQMDTGTPQVLRPPSTNTRDTQSTLVQTPVPTSLPAKPLKYQFLPPHPNLVPLVLKGSTIMGKPTDLGS